MLNGFILYHAFYKTSEYFLYSEMKYLHSLSTML